MQDSRAQPSTYRIDSVSNTWTRRDTTQRFALCCGH